MDVKLCVVFVLACTLLRKSQGILNADPVEIEDFSYNVVVSYKLDKPYFASGSIIHRRFVLTSGRTFLNVTWNVDKKSVKSVRLSNVSEMEVQVLTNSCLQLKSKPKKNEIIEKVTTLYVPQKWLNSNTIDGGIAILKLENDLDLSREIQVLRLPTTNLNYMKDYEKFGVFTGFGYDSEKNANKSLKLMEVEIVDCPKTWVEAGDMSQFCGSSIVLQSNINNSRNQTLGASFGDQGGPLVYRKNTIIGALYNFGVDNRLGQNKPAIFTNISHHLDFINDVISGQPSLHITMAIPLICTAT